MYSTTNSTQQDEEICRDDRCNIEEIHPRHILSFGHDPFIDPDYDNYWNCTDRTLIGNRHGQALTESILNHISERSCKTFSNIYHDVLSDYGTVVRRTVNRRIARLVEEQTLVRIYLPSNSQFCGYVQASSRLLHTQVGMKHLLTTLEAQIPTKGGTTDEIDSD